MAIQAGLHIPTTESVSSSIPSVDSVAESISNVPSASQLEQGSLNTLAEMQAMSDSIGYEPPDESPQVFYSPSTKQMFVNGLMFDDDDAKTALESVEKLRDRPLKPSTNIATDWTRVSPEDYGSYIKGIKNPQAGRLAAENFDIGGSNLKLLYGRASQFFGAEDYGQGYVDEAIRELEKNEPFQREFTNIKSGYIVDGDAGESHDAIDWFVANLAQQGPNLIESVLAALLGGVIGGVTGANPFTAVGGAIASVLKKESYKNAVIKAAKKYKKDPATLDPGERKLLREISSLTAVAEQRNPNIFMGMPVTGSGWKKKILKENKALLDDAIDAGVPGAAKRIRDVGKGQAISGGAALGVGTSSYGIGLGDVYGEQREMGQDNRLSAALTAIPYAAMEMLPEFILAARIFNVKPRVINKTLLEGTDQGGRTARALKGFGVGGALEGTTEVAQESLILFDTGQLDAKSPQVQKRLVNAFFAGFFVGGPIGGVANLLSRPSSDILNKNNQRTEPNDPAPDTTAGAATGTVLGEQLSLPGIYQPTGRDEFAAGTRRILSAPVSDTQEVPVDGQLPLPLGDIKTKRTKKEIKNTKKEINALEKNLNALQIKLTKKQKQSLEKATETAETKDTTKTKDTTVETKDTNAIAAIAKILENRTNKETKNIEKDLNKITTTTTTSGKTKLTAVDKFNQRLAEIETFDIATLAGYELKTSGKDWRGRKRTIGGYTAKKIEGVDTEELSKVLMRKLSKKATLEREGKVSTAEYRNIITDIAAIQRYLQLASVVSTTGLSKADSTAGEEEIVDNSLKDLEKQADDLLRKGRRKSKTTGKFKKPPVDTTTLPKTTEEINAIDRAKTEFDPREEPRLIDESNAPELTAPKQEKARDEIAGGREEGDITDPNRRKEQFESIDYVQKNRGNITPEGLKELYGDILFNIMILTPREKFNFNKVVYYQGAFYKGGIIIDGKYRFIQEVVPNLLAHELGHASHAYYGADINNQITIKDELKAIENYMYPGLREKILAAEKAGKKIDTEFFNYLLNPEELIAEFNVNRILNPAETQPLAPIIYQTLEAAQNQIDLVRKRKVFPNGSVLGGVVEVNKNFEGDYAPFNFKIDRATKQTKQDNLKRGKDNADTEQKTTEVATGKQARGSRTTTTGDKQTTDVGTADIKGAKEPVGEEEKGKAKLQVKKKEDTTGQVNEKLVAKSANIKREDKQTEVETKFEQKLRIDKITKARAKPKDFKKKYKNTQEAWDDIKPVIAGGSLIQKIPASINNSIAKAVQESTAIDTAEIRNLFLNLTEQDFVDINVEQTVYTNMRIAQFEAALLDNAIKDSILSDIVDIGWLDKESKFYGDKFFTKDAVKTARNFLNTHFARTGVYTENEAVALDNIIYDRLTTKIAEEGDTGLAGAQTDSELRIKEAIAWTKRRDRYQSIIDQRLKKLGRESTLTGAAKIIAKDQPKDVKKTGVTDTDTEPDYTAIQVHDLIKNQISEKVGTVPIQKPARSVPKKNIEKKYAQLSDEDKNYGINKEGDLLSDYFDDKGKLITYRTTSAENSPIHKPIRKQNLKEREAKEIEVLAPFIEDTTEEGTTILKEVEQKLDAGLKKKGYTVIKTDDGTIVKQPVTVSKKDKLKKGEKLTDKEMTQLADEEAKKETEGIPEGQAFLTKKDLSEKDIDDILADVDDNPEDTMFYRLDGSIIKNPVPILRVRAIVNKALSKLQLKPNITVVKDKAELESKFPELYERAVAGRQQGDFDTTNFASYSQGNEIVVFADNIKTEEQLKFIVAHETLGHFGLRAFVPDGKLNAVLEDLYNSEGHIKAVADMHIKNGMDKYIAIEEAMANAAATLDVSAIQRIWFAIKNFLNKIGIKFDDDLSRYILSQSRRNLRTGGGSYFNVKQLVSNMQDEYDRATQTRFYTEQMNTSLPAAIFGMFGITANNTTGSFNGFKDIIKNKLGLDIPKAIGSVLEYVQTLGNISVRNEGMRSIFNIFGMQAKKIKSLERTYETLTQFSTKPNVWGEKYKDEVVVTTTEQYEDLIKNKKSGTEPGNVGPTHDELDQVGDLLSYAALLRAKQNGEDSTVAKPLDKNRKEISLRQEVEGGQAVNREAAKELGDMGLVSIEEFLDGIPFDISLEDDTGKLESRKFKPKSITPRVYKMYLEIRTAINKSAVDVFESSLEATTFERQDAINNFLESVDQDSNLTGARETFELIMEKYREIRQERATGDKQTEYTSAAKRKSAVFIREVNRALFEPLKLKDWRDGNAGIGVEQNYNPTDWVDGKPKPGAQPIFRFDPKEKEYERIIEGLEELNVMFNKKQAEANTVTNTIKSLFALEEATKLTEFNSKRTLMTGYVQFIRRGKYQVETVAFDKDRNRVKLDQQHKNAMPYFQAETEQDAREIQKQVNETFGKNPFVVKDRSGQEIEVTLEASRSVARTASLMSLDQNLSAFLRTADKMQINISVNDRDKIIKGLTDTGSAARQKLPRAGKPGWNKEVVRNQAMFLRAQSHLAGKTYFEHKLNTVLASEKQWTGDIDKLNRLKATLDEKEQFGNEQEKQLARANYDSYANMYRYSAGTVDNPASDITIYEMKGALADKRTPRQVKPEGRGEDYRQQAQDILAYYSSGENIVDSTEDILEKTKVGQNLRVLAVSSQLGGSVATALINTMSMVTHSIPYLATYNPKTGYGGGFGMVAAAYEMQRAAREMSDATRTRLGLTEAGAEQSLANLDWMNKVAGFDPETGEYITKPKNEKENEIVKQAKQLQDQYNISPDEAQAIHKATSDGVLQAAQYNALVGTARGGLTNTTSGMLKKWMSLFSYTEQLNRRATFLAAYRLQKAKLRAANEKEFNVKNITPERTAELNKGIELEASKFAEVAVNTSQGEYSMFNRPKISRGPLLNSLFMYKQFVAISVELMKNLGRNERIYFLMLLFLLSGMKGLPFAEDVADLFDTLMQMFGVKMGTIEKELTMFTEEVAPGLSPWVMRGVLDKITGATMSTRLGFGDIVPLTGIGKAGSSFEQEVTNFLGPVYAAGEQTVAAATLFTNWSAGLIGLKADTTRFRDVLRSQPFGGIRGITDAYTYYDDGVITNKQGKVLDKDVHFKEIFFRALNFHPASASYQNDIIRMTKQTGDYVKSFKIKFSEAYVKARISGDKAEMRRIERDVRAHNRTHRNSEFYLDNWKASANRMYDAWKYGSAERFKKYATKRSRPDIEKLMEAYDIQ